MDREVEKIAQNWLWHGYRDRKFPCIFDHFLAFLHYGNQGPNWEAERSIWFCSQWQIYLLTAFPLAGVFLRKAFGMTAVG